MLGIKEKLVNLFGSIGIVLYYVSSIILSVLPLLMIEAPFIVNIVILLVENIVPFGTTVLWIVGLIFAIIGNQDIFSIIYYVVSIFIFWPFIHGIFSYFKSENVFNEIKNQKNEKKHDSFAEILFNKQYYFWELLDHEYIKDYSYYLSLRLKSPYRTIARVVLGFCRFIMIILTIIILLFIISLFVSWIVLLIVKGGTYAIVGLTISVIAINTINYFATYKSRMRHIWYFWICLFASIIAYVYAIFILLG